MINNIKQVNSLEFITRWEGLDETRLSDSLKLTIFRIVQEQLNNILKHAQARSILILLAQKDCLLELSIKDDGIGFDSSKKRNGVGLQNIISRAELYSGKVLINSEPGKGCELIVLFIANQKTASAQKVLRA